jgi:fatty acid/phospholipid biosynthesis enzyme
MRIALDAMGSDRAPGVDVRGGIRAARRFGHEIVLVGREADASSWMGGTPRVCRSLS